MLKLKKILGILLVLCFVLSVTAVAASAHVDDQNHNKKFNDDDHKKKFDDSDYKKKFDDYYYKKKFDDKHYKKK